MRTNAAEMLQPVIDRLQSSANVKTVFGEPFESHGKTYVPVATVAYGFGGGKGSGKDGAGEGGGLGGGVHAKPAGVLEITEEGTRFIRFEPDWRKASTLGLILVLSLRIGLRLAKRR